MTCRKRRDDVETAGGCYCGNSLDETCLRAGRHPALRWPESVGRRLSGTWEPRLRCKRRSSSGRTTRARVRMRRRGAEQPVVAKKFWKQDGAKGLSTRGEEQWPATPSGNRMERRGCRPEAKSNGRPYPGIS